MRKEIFTVIYALLIFTSCISTNKPTINYELNEVQNTDYSQVKIKTIYDDSQIEIDSVICKRILLSLENEQNYIIKSSIWMPKDSVKSKNKLCLLIPSATANKTIMYPIAVKLIKKNIPIMFLSYHGVKNDLMENYAVDYGLKEINDGIVLLKEVQKFLNYDSLVTVIYGVSLGGVVALNIAENYPDIKAIVLEALPYNLITTSKKIFSKSIAEMMINEDSIKIEDYQPGNTIPKLNNKINVQALWSLSDEYIDKNDIDNLINLFKDNNNQFEYHLINKKMHHFRYIYPLTKNENDSLNNLIVEFIFKNIYK